MSDSLQTEKTEKERSVSDAAASRLSQIEAARATLRALQTEPSLRRAALLEKVRTVLEKSDSTETLLAKQNTPIASDADELAKSLLVRHFRYFNFILYKTSMF